MIDLERETLVTLAEAPRVAPRINAVPGMDARKPLHERTIRNWTTRGKHGVVLETVSIGGLLVTSREALTRFFQRLSEARQQRMADREHASPTATKATRARSKQSKAYVRAREELAREHQI